MFETVDALNKALPNPAMTGDPHRDLRIREHYIARAKTLRSEAFACLGRSFAKRVRRGWDQLSAPSLPPRSHQA